MSTNFDAAVLGLVARVIGGQEPDQLWAGSPHSPDETALMAKLMACAPDVRSGLVVPGGPVTSPTRKPRSFREYRPGPVPEPVIIAPGGSGRDAVSHVRRPS